MSDHTRADGQGKTHRRIRANRREFMKASAIVGMSAFAVGRGAWADESAPASKSPNGNLGIACIGVGGKGDSDSSQVGLYGNVVAICDIDDKMLAKKAEQFPKAEKFNDFRKMFDALGKSIDAVTVSVPDNCHAVASMMAMKMGKHVYCQKPLTRTIREAREMRMAAREHKVCTQMGNQGTAHPDTRHAVDILRAGALGPVKEVHIWTNRPIWPQAPKVMARLPEEPVPSTVHWDEWIGPAPMRPYNAGYHPFKWRGWWDFGTGALGDMGCHTANMPYMGLELGYPTSIEAKCGDLNDETYPSWATIVYHFPARGDKPAVKLTWWEGHRPDSKDAQKRNLPDTNVTRGFTLPDSGSLVIGEKAMMFSLHDYGANDKIVFNADTHGTMIDVPDFLPKVPMTASQHGNPKAGYNNDEGQKAEWIAAIKSGKAETALSNFDYAGMLTEFLLLGNIAIKTGKKLEWDGPGMKFTNNDEANSLIHREYRKGWSM
jgi:predicted dehydrogenase